MSAGRHDEQIVPNRQKPREGCERSWTKSTNPHQSKSGGDRDKHCKGIYRKVALDQGTLMLAIMCSAHRLESNDQAEEEGRKAVKIGSK